MDTNTNKALQSFLKVASAFLAIAIIVLIVGAVSIYKGVSSANNYTDTIEVSGVGTVKASPDVAKITFGHTVEREDLATAQSDLEDVMSEAIDSLDEFDIAKEDISQQSYNSYPRYEYRQNCTGINCVDGNRVLVGYEVQQTIQVTVREIDNAGEVLAALGSTGVTRLNGPAFEIDDPSIYQQEARSKAIEDARAEAKILANDLGVRLGKMIDFYENSYGGPMPYATMRNTAAYDMVAEEAEFKEVTVPVGEDEIQVNVTLVFKIK